MDNKYQIPYISKEEYADRLWAQLQANKEYRTEKIEKGKVLYRSDINDNVVFVLKGRLKLAITNSLGAEKIVFFFLEKTFCTPFLPEICDVLSLRLIVDEDCELAYFKRKWLVDYMFSNRDIFDKFVSGIGKRLAILYSNVLDIQTGTSKNRVFNLICQAAINNGIKTEQGYVIRSFPSVRDISLISGVHTRNIYKYVQELEKLDVIARKKGDLLVKDMEKLQTHIEEGYKA